MSLPKLADPKEVDSQVSAALMFESGLDQHFQVAAAVRARLAEPFGEMLDAWEQAVRGGGKILLFGNGGSAADAQHIATELVVRLHVNRPSISAIALTTDTSALTAAANDFGFESVFARQIEGLGRKGDLALGLSTSGDSGNVVRGLETARRLGLATAAFTGETGGKLIGIVDHCLCIPSADSARIQEMHITLGHLLCAGLEARLGYA
jgi:D-sedoheptulose 7-phosphate isomerase